MPEPTDPAQSLSSHEVNRIALQAISLLAPDLREAQARRKLLETYVSHLSSAVLAPDPAGMQEVLRDMRRACISHAEVAENYIPAVALRLGELWCTDKLAFGAVTIGCARLQGLLRRMEADWGVLDGARLHGRPGYLVGVPDGVQHTLGATVLAGQLRHRGAPVLLEYELTPQKLKVALTTGHYAGVMLSGSGRKCLDPLRDLVDSAKAMSRSTPVIIGGSILEHVADIQSFTGADMVTSSLGGAMAFCEQALTDRVATGDMAMVEMRA